MAKRIVIPIKDGSIVIESDVHRSIIRDAVSDGKIWALLSIALASYLDNQSKPNNDNTFALLTETQSKVLEEVTELRKLMEFSKIVKLEEIATTINNDIPTNKEVDVPAVKRIKKNKSSNSNPFQNLDMSRIKDVNKRLSGG